MTPLKHLGTYTSRNKEASGSLSTWAKFVLLRPSDLSLDSPLDGCQDPGSGNDGPLLPVLVRRGELPGQGIRLDVFGTWAVGEGEVKPAEEEGLSHLPWEERGWVHPRIEFAEGPLCPMPPNKGPPTLLGEGGDTGLPN